MNRAVIRRMKALIIKEFRQVFRDSSSLLIAFLLPLIMLFLYGYGINLDTAKTRIAVVMESVTPEASSLLHAFTGSIYFKTFVGHDRRQFEQALTDGKIRGIVVIPQDFARRLGRPGTVAPLQVLTDGSEPNTASFVQSYVQGAWASWLTQRALAHPGERGAGAIGGLVTPNPRVWYNPELRSMDYLLPGSLAIVLTLVGTLLTALVVAREWERGTMEALIATPVTVLEILISKFIPYFILGNGTFLMCLLILMFWFGVPLRGSVPALYLTAEVFLCCALGTGLWISAATKNQFAASQNALLVGFLPAFLLSGYIYEISNMPWIIQQITQLLPARHFVSNLQTQFLVGDVWPIILPNLFGMALIAGFLTLQIAKQTKKTLD